MMYSESKLEGKVLEIAQKHKLLAKDAVLKVFFASEPNGRLPFWGRCVKMSGLEKTLTNLDFVILVNQSWWEKATQPQRDALLLHELLHITKNAQGGWSLMKHTIEEFVEVVQHFGAWRTDLEPLFAAVKSS